MDSRAWVWSQHKDKVDITHIEAKELRYATSVRAFRRDKKPQFLERDGFPRVNKSQPGYTFVLTGRGYIRDIIRRTPGWRPNTRSMGVRGKADVAGSEGWALGRW